MPLVNRYVLMLALFACIFCASAIESRADLIAGDFAGWGPASVELRLTGHHADEGALGSLAYLDVSSGRPELVRWLDFRVTEGGTGLVSGEVLLVSENLKPQAETGSLVLWESGIRHQDGTGGLLINTSPSQASVKVNGVQLPGASPLLVRGLVPGGYLVEVTGDRSVRRSELATVQPGTVTVSGHDLGRPAPQISVWCSDSSGLDVALPYSPAADSFIIKQDTFRLEIPFTDVEWVDYKKNWVQLKGNSWLSYIPPELQDLKWTELIVLDEDPSGIKNTNFRTLNWDATNLNGFALSPEALGGMTNTARLDLAGAYPVMRTVTLNGSPVDAETALRGLRVRAGHHQIEARVEGWEPFQTDVDVSAGDVSRVEIRMAAATQSTLTVKVFPPLADVRLDGNPPQTADTHNGVYRFRVAPGKHAINAEAPGYLDETINLRLEPGETAAREIMLKQLRVDLMLKLNPTYTKSELFDDKGVLVHSDQGRGLVLKSLAAGNYRLVLSADGWQTMERTLSLMQRENEFSFELNRLADAEVQQAAAEVPDDRGLLIISTENLRPGDFPLRIGGLVIDGEVALDPFKDRSGNVWLRSQSDELSAEILPGDHRLDSIGISIAGKNYTRSKTVSFNVPAGKATRLSISLDKRRRLVVKFSEH